MARRGYSKDSVNSHVSVFIECFSQICKNSFFGLENNESRTRHIFCECSYLLLWKLHWKLVYKSESMLLLSLRTFSLTEPKITNVGARGIFWSKEGCPQIRKGRNGFWKKKMFSSSTYTHTHTHTHITSKFQIEFVFEFRKHTHTHTHTQTYIQLQNFKLNLNFLNVGGTPR